MKHRAQIPELNRGGALQSGHHREAPVSNLEVTESPPLTRYHQKISPILPHVRDNVDTGVYPLLRRRRRVSFRYASERADRRRVFDQPFFLLPNVAVGGNFMGAPDDSTRFPEEMVGDYVRYTPGD